ncbi:hypothetical protein, partial [Phaeobacter gallaeciensis]|uniref:hypothetical protein n=1 Tax=Phaeobacter gallaeciensis TaxID=60890 RepID=UPI00237FC06C
GNRRPVIAAELRPKNKVTPVPGTQSRAVRQGITAIFENRSSSRAAILIVIGQAKYPPSFATAPFVISNRAWSG